MFRVALTAVMLLQSLTGPNPCCCSVGRMVAMTMSWAHFSGNQGTPSYSCCQSQTVGELGDNQGEDRSCCRPLGSKGPTKNCKCQKNLCNAVPSPNSDFTVDVSRSWLDGLALTLAAPVLLDVGEFFTSVMYPDRSLPATRSGREIRVALHSWQC